MSTWWFVGTDLDYGRVQNRAGMLFYLNLGSDLTLPNSSLQFHAPLNWVTIGLGSNLSFQNQW